VQYHCYLHGCEDYRANTHRAYKIKLKGLAENNPGRIVKGKRGLKVFYYHRPSYSSFNKKMNLLAREGPALASASNRLDTKGGGLGNTINLCIIKI